MRKTVVVAVIAAVVSSVASVGAVAAVGGWRVFASSSDRGAYGTFASANASVQNPNGLAVRAVGRSAGQPFEINWTTYCDGVVRARSGQVVVLSIPASAKCMLQASVSGGAGHVRLDLLRR